jgi:hypothetical protein
MEIVEIKIDRTSLPKDGQKIKWQTQIDLDFGLWKYGKFSEGDNLFVKSSSYWDLTYMVLHWVEL